MDLLLRKVVGSKGEMIEVFTAEVEQFITSQSSIADMAEFIMPLNSALEDLNEVTKLLLDRSAEDLNEIGAAANDYLHLVGYTAMAFVWAKMAGVSLLQLGHSSSELGNDFYQSKVLTARYYFARLLPRRLSLITTIKSGGESLFAISDELF
jgi:hypothetical protein